MKIIKAAVGSTRPSKIRAVLQAMQSLGACFHAGLRFDAAGFAVPSGVSHTPASRAELMAGAQNRAQSLIQLARQQGQNWDYFVGLEGGLDVLQRNGRRLAFLESWAFVTDGGARQAWGHAGGILLPEALAREVLDHGLELAQAVDAFAGQPGIRNAQGAWGILTGNVIRREDVLRTAAINAFAPFFNSAAYSP